MDPSQVSMWLPRGFSNEVQSSPWRGKYCFFDATQRGDMYHIRAWQALQKGKVDGGAWHPPAIIYNYVPTTIGDKKSNETTVDYITEIIPQETWKFVTRWSWEELTRRSAKVPTHETTKYDSDSSRDDSILEWVSINSKSIGPSECTEAIRASADNQRSHQKKEFTIIPENMVNVKVDNRELLDQLDDSYKSCLPDKGIRRSKVAVILWRDTLASGGPYPELNTGAESAKQLISMLKSFGLHVAFIDVAAKDMRGVLESGVHCGETPYYMNAVLKSNLWPESSGRDREAFWVKRAYEKERFDLVVGLRSGALDNMTFLGIPTVSIGLEDMIGEGRMHKLGGDIFKRINVDYATPRHRDTALVRSRHGEDLVFQSPVKRTPNVSEDRETALRKFTPFDARTVRIGILHASTKYLNCEDLEPQGISNDLQNSRLVTAKENRAHWDGKKYTKPEDWNKGVEALENADYELRAKEQHQTEINESAERYEAARERMRTSWTELRARVATRAANKGKGSEENKQIVGAGRDQKKAEKVARKEKAAAKKNKDSSGTEPEAKAGMTGVGGPSKA